MGFENESTFVRMAKKGNQKEFNRMYEDALKDVTKFLGQEYPNIIGKNVMEKEKIHEVSPIDGTTIGTFQSATKESVDSALNMLKGSYRNWFSLGYVKRSQIFMRAADELSRRKFELSAILAYENGKTRAEAVADLDEGIDFLRYYSLNLIENQGFIRFTGKGYDNEESQSVMKPYGIFAVIAPFNFYAITVGMVCGPLITGNSVIFKPSSNLLISSHIFANILYEAGVPKEVLAFVSGKGSVIGPYIVSNKHVSGVLFTGSRDAGMDIFRRANEAHPKVVITEMGGKDAIIVTDKANIQRAVNGVYRASFGYSGQKCSACSIAYIQSGIYDKFKDQLLEMVKKTIPGDPRIAETYLGPVINEEALNKYKKSMEIIRKESKVIAGGNVLDKKGFYVEPTLVENPEDDSYVIKNELFLPVLAIKKVNSLKEAVEKVNASDYGLTGGIFTEDSDEIQYYFENAEVGVLYANRERGGSTGAMVGSQPFVGWKLSGISGKGTGSFYYLQQFLREQSQTIAH